MHSVSNPAAVALTPRAAVAATGLATRKPASVISDVMGMSGRAMIEAIIRGEHDPERLADLSQGRLKRPARL